MALFRGIQEYIVSIEGNIFLYPPKKSHPILLLLFIYLCVILISAIFLFTNSAYGVNVCVERSSSGNIQVTYSCPGNNVSEHAQIYVKNMIACHKARGIHNFILATKSPIWIIMQFIDTSLTIRMPLHHIILLWNLAMFVNYHWIDNNRL